MARIINGQGAQRGEGMWSDAGPDFVTLVLDRNEAVAVRRATREYRLRVASNPPATSLNASGARVYDALEGPTQGLH